jgi:fructose-1,6-bisphosphatase/sedoheptulose 1,7-bisphosphatase-like protein
MSKQSKTENLVKVKTTLAEKYEHLAKIVKSRPRRKSYITRAEHHRRQARMLGNQLS